MRKNTQKIPKKVAGAHPSAETPVPVGGFGGVQNSLQKSAYNGIHAKNICGGILCRVLACI